MFVRRASEQSHVIESIASALRETVSQMEQPHLSSIGANTLQNSELPRTLFSNYPNSRDPFLQLVNLSNNIAPQIFSPPSELRTGSHFSSPTLGNTCKQIYKSPNTSKCPKPVENLPEKAVNVTSVFTVGERTSDSDMNMYVPFSSLFFIINPLYLWKGGTSLKRKV